MLLLIDNYDSFTYNLYQYLCELGAEVHVERNDALTVAGAVALAPDQIVLSPGPCRPREAGISVDLVRQFAGRVPVLGVCLGHQCIGEAFGAVVSGAGEIRHGKLSSIAHDRKGLFAGVASPFQAIRYHSLAVEPESVPQDLLVTARSDSGIVMGLRHRRYAVEGIQFHPESIMTPEGKRLLGNFLAMREPQVEEVTA